jgi:DNA polymerase
MDSPLMSESTRKRTGTGVLPAAGKTAQLDALDQQVRSCTLCPKLVASRTQTVFGVGDPDTRLCFFGEAPGGDEDRIGEPFVGRAGQLLNKIIEACALKRSDVYILNTVKCRPENNRTPEPDEIENCRPFFEQQLEIIRPDFICCLGLVAARALLGTNLSIGKLRGRMHRWRFAEVLVTYHPAYLLRNPDAKRLAWEDMQLLMRQLGIDLTPPS